MKFPVTVFVHFSFLYLTTVSSEHVGTCFLSPFQLPSNILQAPPSNSKSEFRTAFAFNQLSPNDPNPLTSLYHSRQSSAHGNAAQIPPDKIGNHDRFLGQEKEKPVAQEKEKGQVKGGNTDRTFDGFVVFPGERPDRPATSTTQRPKLKIDRNNLLSTKGTDTRFVFPGEGPTTNTASPTKGMTDTRFVFPGEVFPPFKTTTTTTTTQSPPILQQKERPGIRRPTSRFGTKGFRDEDIFAHHRQSINRAELEAISQFEAALEEAKREGLYGLRTRSRPRTVPAPPRPVARSPRVKPDYAVKTYHSLYSSGSHGDSREDSSSFFDLGVRDFKESFGFDPVEAGLISGPRSGQRTRQPKQFDGSSDDDGFGPRLPPPPPLTQVLPVVSIILQAPVTSTPGTFYDWLERSSFLTNMRIAPGTNFTVLLPNDAAISLLPPAFIEELKSNATKLREILFYHIIPESIGVETIESEDMIPTLLRKKDIRVTKGSTNDLLMMSGARVLGERSDLQLDSGKVRFIQIDRVLVPPRGTLYEVISGAPGLSIFKRLIDSTGLRSEMEREANLGTNGLTIFAPTDDAFAHVNDEAASLLTRDTSVARSFLLNHVARPVIFASAVPTGSSIAIKNLNADQDLRIERPSQELVRVNDITIAFADVLATNGVLHVIDHVLL